MDDDPLTAYRTLIRSGEIARDAAQELAAEKLNLLHRRLKSYRPPEAREGGLLSRFGFGRAEAPPEPPQGSIWFAVPRHPYTRGLLDAVPRLDRDDESLPAIPGDPLSMKRLPAGCPFAARCPRVIDRCHHDRPALELHGPRHRVACHRPLEDPP